MQKEIKGTKKYGNALNSFRKFFPINDQIKEYDKKTYELLNSICKKPANKKLELLKKRVEKSEKALNIVRKFIHDEWKSRGVSTRKAISLFIEVFELKEHYDKLIILSFDTYKEVREQAKQSFKKLMNKSVYRWLKKEKNRKKVVGIVREFVDEKLKSKYFGIRGTILSLIGEFELEEYFTKLVIFSFDGTNEIKDKAKKSFKKIMGEEVEDWLRKGENRRKVMGAVKEFIEKSRESEDSDIKKTVASLIGFFELEEYYDKLIELSFDKNEKVRKKVREGLNKIGLKGFKEYLGSLSKKKIREMNEKFGELSNRNRRAFIELAEDCSPLLILSVY